MCKFCDIEEGMTNGEKSMRGMIIDITVVFLTGYTFYKAVSFFSRAERAQQDMLDHYWRKVENAKTEEEQERLTELYEKIKEGKGPKETRPPWYLNGFVQMIVLFGALFGWYILFRYFGLIVGDYEPPENWF